MVLIIGDNNTHVSLETVQEFEKIILQTEDVRVISKNCPLKYKLTYLIVRIFRKIKINIIPTVSPLYRQNPWKDSKHLFTIMMALDELKFRPYILTSFHNKSIYLFDAWPKDYIKIQNFIRKYRINYLFVTAHQSAENLQTLLPKTRVCWVPEGISPQSYHSEDYSTKIVDVLALGRKYDIYHNLIVDALAEKGYTYMYEIRKGDLIFPTREEFFNGLARTKISICVPSNITHPDRAGDVETMTIRYLQSMISKCLVLGHAPKEMIELFGYNPVIEIDMENPVTQIELILTDFDNYIPLIEKNYQHVIQNHTWQNRWNQMKNIWSNNIL